MTGCFYGVMLLNMAHTPGSRSAIDDNQLLPESTTQLRENIMAGGELLQRLLTITSKNLDIYISTQAI